MATVAMPIPSEDFDPSEVAISWSILSRQGHRVTFATPDGLPGKGDPIMLSGEGLDFWGLVPGLRKAKLLGLALRANAAAREAYFRMASDAAFKHPLRHDELKVEAFDGLLLPGGHRAGGMKPYLESASLQAFVGQFFASGKPVAAICHGVLLAARSRSSATGRSALWGRRTTALTWRLENSAWSMMKYLGRFWDPNYYRTYVESSSEPRGYWGVQAEVERALKSPSDFLDVSRSSPDRFRKGSGLFRDSPTDQRPAFVVQDGVYLSARWPGDVHTFARRFCDILESGKT